MISVILPVHNRETTILRAVESVLAQENVALECIVVDDGSTDGTLARLETIGDARLRVMPLPVCGGACRARNAGVAAARGEFIAFQDSDDVFHPDKLARQLRFLQEKQADVVVCAMRKITTFAPDKCVQEHVPQHMPETITHDLLLQENLCSTQCLLGRAEVFRSVPFDEGMPRLQDWALMLDVTRQYRVCGDNAELVDVYVQSDSLSSQPKRLLPALTRLYLRYAEEINASCPERWVVMLTQAGEAIQQAVWTSEMQAAAPEWLVREQALAALGDVCIGQGGEAVGEKPLLTMNLSDLSGMGEGKRYLPPELLPEVVRHCRSLEIAGVTAHTDEERAMALLSGLQNHALAWHVVCRVYGDVAATAALAAVQHMQMPRWAQLLRETGVPKTENRPIRRVAAYYHSVCGGGVQRVTAKLLHVWASMGFQVTLITSQAPQENDEALPEGIRRVVIPPFDPFDAKKRMAHVHALADAAAQVDVVVDHAWADPMLLFDVLAIRQSGAKVLIHTHSVFSMTLLRGEFRDRWQCMPDVAALADGVVTLSNADTCYFRQYAPRVFQTCNPLTVRPEEVRPNALSGRNILWVGRNSPEKRPQDAVRVAKWVAERVPGTTLTILGAGFEQDAAAETSPVIHYAGFHRETESYYAQADVYLCTSEYEGFSLTIAEAQAHGIPCVCYDMPYLPILQGGGHVSVPMGDVDALGKAVADLLLDASRRNALGAAARQNVRRLHIDQSARWQEIFASLTQDAPTPCPQEDVASMLSAIHAHAMPQEQVAPVIVQHPFIPMPEKGPFKRLRKKFVTLCKAVLIDGGKGIWKK